MPDKDAHIAQAKYNEKLAEELVAASHLGWAATLYFYAAVHWVESFLAVQKIHSEDHVERRENIHKQPLLRPIFNAYNVLQTMSEDARYDCLPVGRDDMKTVVEKFTVVKNRVCKVMGITP